MTDLKGGRGRGARQTSRWLEENQYPVEKMKSRTDDFRQLNTNRRAKVKSRNLVVDVLLELQLLLQGLQAVLGVHSPQHLVLQLLLGIG